MLMACCWWWWMMVSVSVPGRYCGRRRRRMNRTRVLTINQTDTRIGQRILGKKVGTRWRHVSFVVDHISQLYEQTTGQNQTKYLHDTNARTDCTQNVQMTTQFVGKSIDATLQNKMISLEINEFPLLRLLYRIRNIAGMIAPSTIVRHWYATWIGNETIVGRHQKIGSIRL